MKIIDAAKMWDLEKYEAAVLDYVKLIDEEINRTKTTIDIVLNNLVEQEEADLIYSKKQAAELIGVTEEMIRNWERNELLPRSLPYQKRFYSQKSIKRMYLIRLLLNNGYSILIIRRFFMHYDAGEYSLAVESLMNPDENEDLLNVADKYLQALYKLKEKAEELYLLVDEMKKL